MIFVSHSHFIRYILKKKRNVILLLVFSSTYIPSVKAYLLVISEKKSQIDFQTKISYAQIYQFSAPPIYRGIIL